MVDAQPGIFAEGTRAHYHLEFDLLDGTSDEDVSAAVTRLREPAVTVGGFNLVVGFGPTLWERLSPGAAPADFHAFQPIEGLDGTQVPATQHDLWVWVHGTGPDLALDAARAATSILGGVGRPSNSPASSTATAATSLDSSTAPNVRHFPLDVPAGIYGFRRSRRLSGGNKMSRTACGPHGQGRLAGFECFQAAVLSAASGKCSWPHRRYATRDDDGPRSPVSHRHRAPCPADQRRRDRASPAHRSGRRGASTTWRSGGIDAAGPPMS